MSYASIVQELDDLIDSLDEHITAEDVGIALGVLRANVFEMTKAHTLTDEREALVAFMHRVVPPIHEPLRTRLAEDWAKEFATELLPSLIWDQ